MIFCEKCFCDLEVITAIRNIGSLGDCPVCKKRNIYIYNTDKDVELSAMFDDLISIYTPVSMLLAHYPRSDTRLLKNELSKNWNIFNDRHDSEIYEIITSILKEKYDENPEIFDHPVGIQELYDDDYLQEHSLLTTNSWSDFTKALKTQNRFHTHHINLEMLEKFCSYIRKHYKKGTVFYRCRISGDEGIEAEKMSAPPIENTFGGRVNAKGIRCLYLGDSPETTIYEVRAGVYDYVTVGKFELKEDVIIVDLKMINQISPFTYELDCKEHAINKEHLNKINDEMGKVMRRNDSFLDYVPTQYISDFIKSLVRDGHNEYAGIEYKSVMHEDGYNLAIFDPELFECTGTETYRIDMVDYKKKQILMNYS